MHRNAGPERQSLVVVESESVALAEFVTVVRRGCLILAVPLGVADG
jgi:hypothetical protein